MVRGGTAADVAMQEHNRRDRAVSTLSRRQAIAGGAALLSAGGTLVWVGEPASAQASVTLGEFSVADASFETDSLDPVVDVDVAFSYDVGTEPVDELELTLTVGETTVTTERLVTSQPVGEATTTLSARIVDADAWTLEDFATEAGDELTHTVDLTLGFAVLDSQDTEIASDTVSESVTIAVSHPQEKPLSARVGGVGAVRDRNA